MRVKCPAFGKVCSACKERNHFSKVCTSKPIHTMEHDDFFIGMINRNEVVGEVTAKDEEWHTRFEISKQGQTCAILYTREELQKYWNFDAAE